MKKIPIIFVFMVIASLFLANITFSSPNPAPNTCSSGVYPISNSFSRGIQKVLGLNTLSTQIAELIIKNQISKLIEKGSIKVHLKEYSAGDLLAGKIKSFDITGKNLAYNDIYISHLKAESLCDFTWFDFQNKLAELNSPLFIKYTADFTKEDFQKIFESDTIKDALKGIKINVNNFNFGEVDFIGIKLDIKNEKINIKANLVYRRTPFTFTFPINLETSIKAKDDRIFLSNLKFSPDSVSDEFRFVTNSIELNNINVFDLKTLEKNGSYINIKKIKIVNDKISVEGTFWLPQNTKL